MDVKIKLIEDGLMPTKGSDGAAAYDLYARDIIFKDNYVEVMLGISTQLPSNSFAIIAARSSLTKYPWILSNGIGIIDADYRGEWRARFRPIPEMDKTTFVESTSSETSSVEIETNSFRNIINEFPYKVGDRVAQFFIQPVINFDIHEVESLHDTSRGTGGFGSTGK